MNVVMSILAGALAVAMLGAGGLKLVTPKDGLADKGMELGELPAAAIKGIGALEVLAGIGLVVPALVNIAPVLVALGGSRGGHHDGRRRGLPPASQGDSRIAARRRADDHGRGGGLGPLRRLGVLRSQVPGPGEVGTAYQFW